MMNSFSCLPLISNFKFTNLSETRACSKFFWQIKRYSFKILLNYTRNSSEFMLLVEALWTVLTLSNLKPFTVSSYREMSLFVED